MSEYRFDTVITGGEVIDPGSGKVGKFNIGILNSKIETVEAGLPSTSGRHHVDASGKIVTAGLVDLHTHVYWGASFWGIEADPVAARTGVTTWIDVGTAGSYSFPGFREWIIEPSTARIYSMLNLSSIGLIAQTGELANPDYWDVELAAEVVERNRDVILGIKVRIDRNTCRGVGIEPMKRARELADRVGLPLMTHIGTAPPTIEELVPHLRPGDILTHCFTWQDMGIMDESGKIRSEIAQLQRDGLILDVGHGTGSFGFDVAEAMMAQGILPDCISTDIHQMAVQGPMFDLPTTLSKFLSLGMSLPDVIERATVNPAKAIGLDHLGTLAPGSPADIAIFRMDDGEFSYYDVKMDERNGSKQLVNELTMIDGHELPKLPERELHFWAKLPEGQQPIHFVPGPGKKLTESAQT
jgi:dihydroorotase